MPTSGELLLAGASAPPDVQSVLFDLAKREELKERIRACTACSLHETCNAPVPFRGGPSSVAIIGEAPGADEDQLGEPFVGRAGQLLTRLLAQAGITSHVTFLNSVCCRPPNNDFAKAIDARADIYCKPFMQEQIEVSGAWILIPVGARATFALTGLTAGITQLRGTPRWIGHKLVIPTFHPAYALRNPDAASRIVDDLMLARRILTGLTEAPVPKGYDPSALIGAMQGATLSDDDRRRFKSVWKRLGWVSAYSPWVEDTIVLVRDEAVVPKVEGVKYTVGELVKLAHMSHRNWEDARRLHYAKREFNAVIL